MNRRRTIKRRGGLLRKLSGPRNRRLQPKRGAAPRAARPPRDWRGLLARCGRVALGGLKLLGILAVLAGVGLGGYHGYRRAMASTLFRVQQVEVLGARRAPREDLGRLVRSLQGRSIFSLDLLGATRSLEAHPWVKHARARRELPSRLILEVEEHRPAALLHLGYLYLVDQDGVVFKRAASEETEGLPVITGLDRAEFLSSPEACRPRLQHALQVLSRYLSEPRPPLSEVHLGARDEVTLYLRQNGLAIRLGTDPAADRLQRFDAVWAALGPEVRRARAILLDHEIRTDRVIVRMGSNQ